jgi:hypothetical protein
MGYRELSRMEIVEVVRRWQAGESQRGTARATGLARETVKKYLAAAGTLGLLANGPPPSEGQLVALVRLGSVVAAPRSWAAPARVGLEPHAERIGVWIRNEQLQLTRVQELLAQDGVRCSYMTLLRYLVPESLVGEHVEVAASEDKVIIRHAGAEIVRHDPVGPGEVAFGDLADPGRRPTRGIRPRTTAEVAFLGLGPSAETFLRSAAAAGTLRLESELASIVELVPIWGAANVIRALGRATRFRRFKAADVRAILDAGRGLPTPVRAGQQLVLNLPVVPIRPLSAYALVQEALL